LQIKFFISSAPTGEVRSNNTTPPHKFEKTSEEKIPDAVIGGFMLTRVVLIIVPFQCDYSEKFGEKPRIKHPNFSVLSMQSTMVEN
jgi:hypothetical protein